MNKLGLIGVTIAAALLCTAAPFSIQWSSRLLWCCGGGGRSRHRSLLLWSTCVRLLPVSALLLVLR
jgi:hypothetical protein